MQGEKPMSHDHCKAYRRCRFRAVGPKRGDCADDVPGVTPEEFEADQQRRVEAIAQRVERDMLDPTNRRGVA
jgi:hypothetical protein